MKTTKWVPCTEELANNPERVKEWKCELPDGGSFKFYEYYDCKIYGRYNYGSIFTMYKNNIQCLIEVEVKERFFTVYANGDGDAFIGKNTGHSSREIAMQKGTPHCAHIIKLSLDGDDLKTEVVWSSSQK